MRPLKKKVSITLDEDVIEKIRLFAEETDRSFRSISTFSSESISARVKPATRPKATSDPIRTIVL